jgi:hypothetical protein
VISDGWENGGKGRVWLWDGVVGLVDGMDGYADSTGNLGLELSS